MTRVLVVDDSAFARAVLSRILRAAGPRIEVVGVARNGHEALQEIDRLAPDVVTLDLTMPELDGIDVLRALAGRASPRVIVVSMSGVDTERGAEALSLGAVDIVTKPTAHASERLAEIAKELVAKVLAVGARTTPIKLPAPSPVSIVRPRVGNVELVMIGTSTGGPQALTRIVAELPATLAAPVVMVLHIPVGYTEALAARLDRGSPLHVVEASDGMALVPGLAVLARGGAHLRVVRDGLTLRAEVSSRPTRPFTPSVDELFLSGTAAVGARGLGVILTGMGDDGLVGSRALAAAGGALLTEAETSCVVYGMPRCVDEAQIGAVSVTLDRVAAEIARRA